MSEERPKKAVYVMLRPDGKWVVRVAGMERAIRVMDSQSDAIQVGVKVAIRREAVLIVYRADGSIRSNDNYGELPPWRRGD